MLNLVFALGFAAPAAAQMLPPDWAQRLAAGRQALVQDYGAPMLADWIRRSRDEAVAAGVQPIPPAVRQKLLRIYPAALLDTVRYRVGGGSGFSLQRNSFGFGHADAITLGDVVVFRTAAEAASAWLWAHEIGHVVQYRALGIDGFALRYIQDWRGLELEAEGRARTVYR
ncbi:MAG TPA: DUF4157 domain-containing protein [Alphaproteobacteria bacterium]|nr:DUF4157 domain-containing protein [Alphaproteobacteria bacterium]